MLVDNMENHHVIGRGSKCNVFWVYPDFRPSLRMSTGDDKKSEDREKDDRELPPADTQLGDQSWAEKLQETSI